MWALARDERDARNAVNNFHVREASSRDIFRAGSFLFSFARAVSPSSRPRYGSVVATTEAYYINRDGVNRQRSV